MDNHGIVIDAPATIGLQGRLARIAPLEGLTPCPPPLPMGHGSPREADACILEPQQVTSCSLTVAAVIIEGNVPEPFHTLSFLPSSGYRPSAKLIQAQETVCFEQDSRFMGDNHDRASVFQLAQHLEDIGLGCVIQIG